MLDSLYRFTSALIDVVLRIVYIPFAVVAWVFSLLPYLRIILFAVVLIVIAYFHARYSSQIVDNGLYVLNRVAAPYYQEEWKPILGGIIRQFYNRFICWYNAFLWFPYGYGREVVFPIMRDAGFGTVVSNAALFIKQVSIDWFLNYLLTGRFFTEEMDFNAICDRWITFWESWQALLCFGCNDICPFLTKLPVIPMMFSSDQIRDRAFWNFVAEFFNGWFVFSQQVIYIIRDVLFPIARKRVTLRADFARAFDLWVSSSTNFWRSFENILNAFWAEFIPFAFDWTDMLQIFNVFWVMTLRSIQLLIDIALNSDRVLDHFSAVDSEYWVESVKEDYKVIIGLLATATFFEPIDLVPTLSKRASLPFPTTITNYELSPAEPSLPNGLANPLFNQILGSSYACLVLERIICDPTNVGIGCSQRFAGTLLEDVDVCCPVNTLFGVGTDFMAFLFEFSLHLQSSDDFVRYIDKQPFTTQFKTRIVDFFNCAFMYFRVVRNYGFCIERVLFELTNFVVCTAELLFRVLMGAVTLPYFEQFLPGEKNFISGSGGMAPVNMAIEFLDRVADETTPDGLVNCFSYLVNTGFQVSFAGCNANSCIPSGFLDVSGLNKRDLNGKIRRHFGTSFYNLTSKTGYYSRDLTPIRRYGDQLGSIKTTLSRDGIKQAAPALLRAMGQMGRNYDTVHQQWSKQKCGKPAPGQTGVCGHPDLAFERIMSNNDLEWNPFRFENMYVSTKEARLATSAPVAQVNCTTPDVVAPCFDLSCLFTKIIQLAAHTIAFFVRALNAFIQSRSAEGSLYFTGESCTLPTPEPCLESDLTMFIKKLIDPLGCLCEFVKLLIPNRGGFEDPCCAFTVAGELFSCIVQILINVSNSINGDAPNYTYIEDPAFLVNDFNIVLRISLALFDCACDFVRKIFSVALQGKEDLVNQFDPCCFLRVFVKAALAAARFLFRVVLSVATLTTQDSQCYMYVRTDGNPERQNCPIGIPKLGAMNDFAQITVALFAVPAESMQRQCGVLRESEDPDDYGAATCYCRAINTLLTMVFKFVMTGDIVSPTHSGSLDPNVENTCVVDLCCPVYRISSILKASIDFLAQFVWSFIQNWEDRSVTILRTGVEFSVFLPQETFEFFFCDEYGPESFFAEGTINTFSLENGGQLDPIILSVAETYNIGGPGNLPVDGEMSPYVNPNVIPLDQSAYPNPINEFLDDGIPSLTQNQPLTSPNNYGSVVGLINTNSQVASAMESREKCGKLEPVIIGVYNLLARCLCPNCHLRNDDAKGIGNIADRILAYSLAFITFDSPMFPFQIEWPDCFCCGGPDSDPVGIVPPFASAFTVAIRQILILFRNIANPGYWQPAGTTLAGGTAASKLADNLEDIKKTWISRFLSPFADASCRFVTNSACLLSMLIGRTCGEGADAPGGNDYDVRYKLISSIWRYAAEALIRVIALFEAMVKLFAQELPGQCVGDQSKVTGNKDDPMEQGSDGANVVPTCSQKNSRDPRPPFGGEEFNPRQLGRIVVSLLTFIFDAIIGVGDLGCTKICPGLRFRTDEMNAMVTDTCSCYNLSPYVGVTSSTCSFEICDEVFNGQANGEFRDPPTFACRPNGTIIQSCTSSEALIGHTGITTIDNEVVPYLEFARNDVRCNGGCVNDTDHINRKIIYQNNGVASWSTAFSGQLFVPAFFQGQLVCESPTIVGTPAEERAGELFGSNFRFFPSVPIPTNGDVNAAKCLCYYPGFDSLNVADSRTFLLAPSPAVVGCGAPYDFGGATTGISPLEATQSVCPATQAVPFGLYSYPEAPAPFFIPQEQAKFDRCNTCLLGIADSRGFVCHTWTRPPDINSDLIDSSLTPCANSGQIFTANSCLEDVLIGRPCSDTSRQMWASMPIENGGCCVEFDGPTCTNFNATLCDLRCTECNAFYLNIPTNGQPSSPFRQPVCRRETCVAKGWCKNDQNVPCARGYNQPVLDGIGIIALKYVRCLMNNLFSTTALRGIGEAVGGVLTFVLHFLSIIWQLSGGIIRFAVSVGMFGFQLAFGVSNLPGFLFSVPGAIISTFNAFINIFRQKVALNAGVGRSMESIITRGPCKEYGHDPRSYAMCMCRLNDIKDCEPMIQMHQKRMDGGESLLLNFEQTLSNFMDYPEAHRCIDTTWPQKCFCSTIDTAFCSYDSKTNTTTPEVIEMSELLQQLSYIFSDDTNCDSIFKHLSRDWKPELQWNDLPYARRVEASACLTKRSRGESWQSMFQAFPRSYFYDTRGVTRLIKNLVGTAVHEVRRYASKRDEKAIQMLKQINETHSFEKRFKMSHTQYLEHLNTRAHVFRGHLMKTYRMNQHSIMLEPLLHMESFYYRYRSGYWSHLFDRAYAVYNTDEWGALMTGSMVDTVDDTIAAARSIGEAWTPVQTHFKGMQEEVHNIYHGLKKPFTATKPRPEHSEPWPISINTTALRELFMGSEDRPSFNWGPRISIEIPDVVPKLQWSERVEYNWNAGKRMLYRALHAIWPAHTTEDIHERFIIAGNCRLMDGLITLGTEVADYCIAEFVENTPTNRDDPLFGNYWRETRGHRKRRFTNDTHEWRTHSSGGDWKRPVLRNQQYSSRKFQERIDRRTYKRSAATRDASGRFHLYEFLIDLIERIFNVDLRQSRDSFFTDFAAWTRNTNVKPEQYPDVGALYWLTFQLRCEWPENLNCSIGVGLREALKTVTIYWAAIILALSLVLPPLLTIFSFAFSIVGYVVAVSTVAWHYSFGCTIMFPSTAISPFMFTVPILPFPVNILPALPECLWDELIALADDIFATSYGFIPVSLFSGPDGTGFVNCYEIGISDGVQNILFLGYYYFGNWFSDLLLFLSSTTFARIIPGFDSYISGTLSAFRFASETQQERQLFCAWWTLPSVILPALLLWLAASFLLIIVPALLAVFTSIITLIPTLPFYDAVTSPGEPTGFNAFEGENDYPNFDEEDEEEEEEAAAPIGASMWSKASRRLERWILPHEKTE